MSLAGRCIAQLDRALAMAGENIILRRHLPGRPPVDVTCRARVDRVSNSANSAGPKVAEFEIIISPTEIVAAGWPGNAFVEDPDAEIDQRIPRENGPDKILMRGENPRTIVSCDPKIVAETLVRINMRVSG